MEEQSSEVQAPTTHSVGTDASSKNEFTTTFPFSAGADLVFWRKRFFELYARQAKITEDQWTGEVLPLLDDEPFHYDGSSEYSTTLKCLMDQYNPGG